MLSIAYMTSRREPHINWFLDSLAKQLGDETIQLIVVDFHKDNRPLEIKITGPVEVLHVAPKPTPWQGPHRITKEDWFAAGNARNTAICLAKSAHIAFVDDLSVLLPGWLNCVWQSTRENYIAFGAYKKMKNLVVENSEVKSFNEHSSDSRLLQATGDQTSCAGNWLFGCSFCMPVEAALVVNGFPEDVCGGIGFEDMCFGLAIGNTKKYSFRYDRRMMTYESEEGHFIDPPMKRSDKGVSPKDKSHAALSIALGSTRYPNQFDLREMRNKVQAGEPFPIIQTPEHDWYDGQPLREM